jgi:hypothetical protein
MIKRWLYAARRDDEQHFFWLFFLLKSKKECNFAQTKFHTK